MNDKIIKNHQRPLTATFAERYGIDQDRIVDVLMKTTMKDTHATPEDVMAFLVVANKYGLNPFTKEIYAFKDRSGAIAPIVSVDGWINIINSHPRFAGMEVTYSENMIEADAYGKHKKAHDWIEVQIYRDDNDHTPKVREYFEEVYRGSPTWASHTKRMHRHKAIIQAARATFGFAGIYDEDEARRINEMIHDPIEGKSSAADLTARFSADKDARSGIVDVDINETAGGDVGLDRQKAG